LKTNPNDLITPLKCISFEGEKNIEMTSGGLTKREYFAALAMQGLLANSRIHKINESALRGNSKYSHYCNWTLAVECADALIEELNKDA